MRILVAVIALSACATEPAIDGECAMRAVVTGEVRVDRDAPECQGQSQHDGTVLSFLFQGETPMLVSLTATDLVAGKTGEMTASGLLVFGPRSARSGCTLVVTSNESIGEQYQLAGHAECGTMAMNDTGSAALQPFELRIPVTGW